MSPKPAAWVPNPENRTALKRLRWRRNISQGLMLFFLLLIPIGCVGPWWLFDVIPRDQEIIVVAAIAVLPVVGLGGAFLMLLDKRKHQRTFAMAMFADRHGLDFTAKMRTDECTWLRAAVLLSDQTNLPVGRNLLVGEIAGLSVWIADYSPVITGREEQTVFFLPGAAEGVPEFVITPRTWVERLTSWETAQNIELPGRQEFSQRFRLQSREPATVATFFTWTVTELLQALPLHYVEVMEGGVLALSRNKLIPLAQFPDILEGLRRLVIELRHSTPFPLPEENAARKDAPFARVTANKVRVRSAPALTWDPFKPTWLQIAGMVLFVVTCFIMPFKAKSSDFSTAFGWDVAEWFAFSAVCGAVSRALMGRDNRLAGVLGGMFAGLCIVPGRYYYALARQAAWDWELTTFLVLAMLFGWGLYHAIDYAWPKKQPGPK